MSITVSTESFASLKSLEEDGATSDEIWAAVITDLAANTESRSGGPDEAEANSFQRYQP